MPAKGAAAARAARGQGHPAAAAGSKKRKAPDVLDSARKAAAADGKAGPSTARPEQSMGGLKASFEQQVQVLYMAFFTTACNTPACVQYVFGCCSLLIARAVHCL